MHSHVLDTFSVPERAIDKPLRVSVTDVYRTMSLGLTLSGRVEQGCICIGDKLLVMPAGSEVVQVKGIERRGEPSKFALAGDNIDLGIVAVDQSLVNSGNVLCDPDHPIPVTANFVAKIVTFAMHKSPPITPGYQVCHVLFASERSHCH